MGSDGLGLPDRMGRHLVTGDEVGRWVYKRIGGIYHAEASTCIGLEDDGVLVAGVVYYNWNGQSTMASIATDVPLTKKFLKAMFRHPFVVGKLAQVVVTISCDNSKSLRLASRMGFAEQARLPDAHPAGDLIFMVLRREDCRFLGDRYG